MTSHRSDILRTPRARTRFSTALFIACTLGFGSDLSAQASRPVVITPDLDKYELGLFYDVLEDPSGDLTVGDVSSSKYGSQFELSNHPSPGHGFTGSAFWMRFTVDNSIPELLNSYLEIGYPLTDRIDLYIPRPDGSFEHREGG